MQSGKKGMIEGCGPNVFQGIENFGWRLWYGRIRDGSNESIVSREALNAALSPC